MARGTTARNIRVPDELWEAAKAAAESEGTNVSAVLVAYLRRYVNRKAPK